MKEIVNDREFVEMFGPARSSKVVEAKSEGQERMLGLVKSKAFVTGTKMNLWAYKAHFLKPKADFLVDEDDENYEWYRLNGFWVVKE